MATKLIKLNTNTGDILLPQTSINNLVGSDNSTPIRVATLDANGKLDGQFIPSTIDDIIELIAMSATAPAECAAGDKYFNTSAEGANAKKIFTATAANTWSETGENPITGVIYLDLSTDRIWRWSGTQMVEISEQISTNTYAAGGIPASLENCSDEFVPTTKAVRAAITASEYELPVATTSSLGGVIIDNTVSNGVNLAVDASGNLSVNAVLASGSTAGTVIVDNTESNGISLDITSGTVKVIAGTASTTAYGTVQLAQASDITETEQGAEANKAITPAALASTLAGKQPILSSTTNVTVSGNSISVADAGNNTKGVVTINGSTNAADLSTGSISIDYNNSLSTYAVVKGLETKQDELVPDTNYISMTGSTITTVLQYTEIQNPWA